MNVPGWSTRQEHTLPALGTIESAIWEGRVMATLALCGGLLMLGLSLLVPARHEMACAGTLALVVGVWASLTPPGAPWWIRSSYTAASSGVTLLATVAAERGSSLRLGAIAMLCPLLTVACLRFPREAAAQVAFSIMLYAGYLFGTLPAGPALVGVLASGTVLALLTAVICWLRTRLDTTVDDLRRQAETDGLTGLRNRTGLRTALARTPHPEGALLLVDLDHFKRVNDQLGHEAGDDVLTWFAGLLSDCAGATDLVARYGGEEFVVYLPGPQARSVVCDRAEGLRACMERTSAGRGLPLTISIGVAFGSRDDLPALLRDADRELYAAKSAGRNLVRIA